MEHRERYVNECFLRIIFLQNCLQNLRTYFHIKSPQKISAEIHYSKNLSFLKKQPGPQGPPGKAGKPGSNGTPGKGGVKGSPGIPGSDAGKI